MKTIHYLPIDGMVTVRLDRRWSNGLYGDKNYRGCNRITADTETLLSEVNTVFKFVEKFSPDDEEQDSAPTVNYGDVDVQIEYAYVIKDDDRSPSSWRQEKTFDKLHGAIEHIVGSMPVRDSIYVIRRERKYNEYYDHFSEVVESVYNDPNCNIDGLTLEEEDYIEQIKQYLVLLELKK